MEEILKHFLGSEILSEETKTQITEQFAQMKQTLREQVELEVRAELAESWVQEREALGAKIDTFVSESLKTELEELRGGIESFRDLEAEYAGQLVEAKSAMTSELSAEKTRLQDALNEEIEMLIDKMDQFFEIRLTEEIEDLKEDIQLVKDNKFGQTLFEAFAETFMQSHLSKTGVLGELAEAKAALATAEKQLQESKVAAEKMLRESKMTELLANLQGGKREQMELLLKSVATDRLDETYKQFIGRVLKESTPASTQLSESNTQETQTHVKTGDTELLESQERKPRNDFVAELQRLAGITK